MRTGLDDRSVLPSVNGPVGQVLTQVRKNFRSRADAALLKGAGGTRRRPFASRPTRTWNWPSKTSCFGRRVGPLGFTMRDSGESLIRARSGGAGCDRSRVAKSKMSVERKQSQEHNDLALASGQLSWWDTVRHHGYYYREVAVATLIFGIYLHVSRLVFGDELLLRYLLKPVVDEALAIPMTYAAIAGFAGWKQLRFRSRAHKNLSMFILGFIVISVPIHMSTYFGAPMTRLTAFPMWYSFAEAAVLFPAFVVTLLRIQLANARQDDVCRHRT